jgi:hypothetical protein
MKITELSKIIYTMEKYFYKEKRRRQMIYWEVWENLTFSEKYSFYCKAYFLIQNFNIENILRGCCPILSILSKFIMLYRQIYKNSLHVSIYLQNI